MGFEGNIILAHAYAGLSGEIACNLKYPVKSFASSFTADFNATAFFEWDALFWSGRNDWTFYHTPIYPQTNNNLTVSQSNMNFIEPIDSSMMMFTTSNSNVIKPNIQPYAYPKIINIGNGKMFMTFIDDSSNRSSANRSMLMYSIYDDNNGWSAPLPILDDGTADFEPIIISDNNGGVHILWKNSKVLFNDNITLEDMSENMELHYIHWNGSNFENLATITNNDSYEISAQLAFNGNNLSIVWQENSNNCYYVYPDYSINVFASTPGGTVSGNGIYQKDSEVEVLAMPSSGFVFQGWYENNIRIPGAGSLYSFDAVCSRNLEARFVELESCSIETIEGTIAVVDNQNKYLRGLTPFSNFEDYFIITNGGSVCKIYNNNYSTYNATGVIVQLLSSNGTVVDTYYIVITGDINGDGAIDAFDVIMLDLYLHDAIEIDNVFLAACDMNQDGEVDTTDYTLLRNYVTCV